MREVAEFEYSADYIAIFRQNKSQYDLWRSELANCSGSATLPAHPHLPSFSGTVINVRDGHRVTSPPHPPRDSRSNSSQKVFVFGGSTVFCGEVCDSQTIPASLWNELDKKGFYVSEVINYGRPGSTLTNREYWFLRDPRISSGDLCIFYFGANDCGTRHLKSKRRTPGGSNRHLEGLARLLSRVELFFKNIDNHFGIRLHVFTSLFALLSWPLCLIVSRGTVQETLAAITRIGLQAQRIRCHVYFVLQPSIHENVKLTPLVRLSRWAGCGISPSFWCRRTLHQIGYRRYRKMLQRQVGNRFFDLSFCFVDENDVFENDVFIDECHILARGNHVVASAMADFLISGDLEHDFVLDNLS